MSQEHTEHGGHGEHAGVHLPDPSIWPLVVGLATLFLGAALVWWQRDTGNELAAVAVGASAVFTLFAAAGWAYEDGRMRAKAEAGELHDERRPRYNQVVTFAIAEGALAAAAEEEGVLTEIERANDVLRDLEGFQDLRITFSPAETGPSQVLVETTWAGREELAGYDQTRQTILDILARHEDQVVPGSVQAFDMEVVRDTKEVSFRFGWGAAATMIGAFLVGGFMIGAGLTLFEEEGVAGGVEPTQPPAEDPYLVTAGDNFFNTDRLQAPPNTEVTFTLQNEGSNPHNLAFYESENGTEIQVGDIINGGETTEVTFTTPAVGTYFFRCDVHPTEMTGTFEVTEDAPAPGGGGGGEAPGGENQIVATDNQFDTDELTATSGQEFSITIVNDGNNPHNISFYESRGGDLLAPDAEGEIISGGEETTLTFTPTEAGTFYFQCDVHPTEMTGDFIVN